MLLIRWATSSLRLLGHTATKSIPQGLFISLETRCSRADQYGLLSYPKNSYPIEERRVTVCSAQNPSFPTLHSNNTTPGFTSCSQPCIESRIAPS